MKLVMLLGMFACVFALFWFLMAHLSAKHEQLFSNKINRGQGALLETIGLSSWLAIHLILILIFFFMGFFIVKWSVPVRLVVATLLGIVAAMLPEWMVNKEKENRLKEFDSQLVSALLMMSSSLKGGRNLEQSFEVIVKGMPSPMKDEFRAVLQERRLGVPLEKALENLLARNQSEDLKLTVQAIMFQKETGGNLIELFKEIIFTVSERKRVQGKLSVLTTQVKMEGYIIGLMPLGLFGVLFLISPDYVMVFLTNPIGHAVLGFTIVLMTTGIIIMRKILNIKI